jgi:hypothetical protein
MKRLSILVFAVALVGAACDDTPVSPSNTAPTFTAQLLPGNEFPPVTNADASASGNVTVILNVTRDAAGNVTGGTADFNFVLRGFPPNTTLTGAHIHNGRSGANGPVVIDTGIARADNIALGDGTGQLTRTQQLDSANELLHATNLLNDPAGYYFNVHSALNPAGAVRSQLTRIQ